MTCVLCLIATSHCFTDLILASVNDGACGVFQGANALMIASEYNRKAAVRLLISRGANVNLNKKVN